MTINVGETVFSSAVGICRIAAAMALLGGTLLAGGGCASSNTGNAQGARLWINLFMAAPQLCDAALGRMSLATISPNGLT